MPRSDLILVRTVEFDDTDYDLRRNRNHSGYARDPSKQVDTAAGIALGRWSVQIRPLEIDIRAKPYQLDSESPRCNDGSPVILTSSSGILGSELPSRQGHADVGNRHKYEPVNQSGTAAVANPKGERRSNARPRLICIESESSNAQGTKIFPLVAHFD